MCGICGFTQAVPDDLPILKAMCDTIAHRGPDGEGQYIRNGIALGHRRLSLIDLEGGSQPMVRRTSDHASELYVPGGSIEGALPLEDCPNSQDGAFAIVYNGEIYNYRQLRSNLEEEGWEFRTSSDTEVLLVGYIAWGKDVLDKLRGMFAFAIWNNQEKTLFCARDRFGIKPFYYTSIGNSFIFASETKSILEHPSYERKLNIEALQAYMMFQFSALPETFFKGIFKLEPAHFLTVDLDGSFSIERYWEPGFDIEQRPLEEYVDMIDDVMHDSVRAHNVADVEVGSFLSSGIDSSYMAACLAQENPGIKTFTVGFSEYEGERDEISWARELAEIIGVENYSKHITIDEYWASLPTIQWHMDEPSGDPSAVALYFVDQIAASKVKAVLSGEGADEFFGGYRIYQAPLSNKKLSWLPKGLLRGAAKVMRKLGIRGYNYLERASETPEDWYYTNACNAAFTEDEAAQVLKMPLVVKSPQAIVAPTYSKASQYDETSRMQYVDLYYWLVGDILLKTDKMSMAHSLESRVPFLDKEVYELSTHIPTNYRVSDKQTKIALRDASKKTIPNDWAEKEKLGFPVPIVNWIRQDKYYNILRDEFTSDVAAQFFDTDELVALLDQHRSGENLSRKIWIVYMFLIWYRTYFVDMQKPTMA